MARRLFRIRVVRSIIYFDKCEAWLGYEPGKARVAGFHNRDLKVESKQVAFFGYWETVDAVDPNRDLFESFEQSARSKGAERVYGPINFTTFGPYRIRLNTFEAGCFPGEPYNPSYYATVLDQLGYTVAGRYMSYTGKLAPALESFQTHGYPSPVEHAQKFGVRLEKLTSQYWMDNLESMYEYCDLFYSNNFAYQGISFDAFRKSLGESFAGRFCAKTSVLALDEKGDVAGFIICFPDYAPLCRQGAQHPVPVHSLFYADHFKLLTEPMFISKSGAIHPRFREAGLYGTINYLAALRAQEAGYVYAAGSTIREDNPALRLTRKLLDHPDDLERVYGLFVKELE